MSCIIYVFYEHTRMRCIDASIVIQKHRCARIVCQKFIAFRTSYRPPYICMYIVFNSYYLFVYGRFCVNEWQIIVEIQEYDRRKKVDLKTVVLDTLRGTGSAKPESRYVSYFIFLFSPIYTFLLVIFHKRSSLRKKFINQREDEIFL